MNTASDSILIDRATANGILHLSKNASYSKLLRSRFKGKVLMSDLREVMKRAARNGAVWSGGELIEIDENALGVSRRSLFRALKTAPHFRITRKVALIERDSMTDFLHNSNV